MSKKSVYVSFLRAVNVGGTGRLPMDSLKHMCEAVGLTDVKTYIASGNVVFTSANNATKIKRALEGRLRDYASKDVGVIMRTATELERVLEQNPFPEREPNSTVVLFLDQEPQGDTLETVSGQVDEELVLGNREVYVHYGSGMGRSKLKFPAQKTGTARNINTIAKMVELSRQISSD